MICWWKYRERLGWEDTYLMNGLFTQISKVIKLVLLFFVYSAAWPCEWKIFFLFWPIIMRGCKCWRKNAAKVLNLRHTFSKKSFKFFKNLQSFPFHPNTYSLSVLEEINKGQLIFIGNLFKVLDNHQKNVSNGIIKSNSS